jgi:hypothetical protein
MPRLHHQIGARAVNLRHHHICQHEVGMLRGHHIEKCAATITV